MDLREPDTFDFGRGVGLSLVYRAKMATKKDFYEVLGLTKQASLEDIKKAYRTLARQHHPDIDKSSGAAERFKEISEAYQVLGDPEKRKAYDQFGHEAFDRNGNRASAGFGGGNPFGGGYRTYSYTSGGGGSPFGDFQDPFSLFEQFFAGSSAGRARQKSGGDDLYFELTVDFKEAIFGVSKNISLPRQVLCPVCLGTGGEKGAKEETCSTCGGRGQVERVQNSIFGQIMTQTTCPTCRGRGQTFSKPCPKCGGDGRIKDTIRTEIKIPTGIDDGATIRYPGLGDVGPQGAKAGDLYLTIRVLPSREFRRRGNDIYSEAKVDLPTAVLGGEVEIPSLEKPVKLKVPAGTQSGTEFRLKGLGIPGRGDQYVRVQLVTPTKLSGQQRQYWEQLARRSPEL